MHREIFDAFPILGLLMSDLKFEFKRPANYKHHFKVVAFQVSDTDESIIKNANFFLKSTDPSDNSEYIISMSMNENELKQNAKFNIASSFFSFLPHHMVGSIVNNEFIPVDDIKTITSLVCTTMDTLAQEISYASIIERNDIISTFFMLITSLTDAEYNPNPVQSELLTASDLKENIYPILYLYEQFQSLLLTKEQKADINYAFWTGLTATTRSNAMVFSDDSTAFTPMAMAKATVTEANLLKAIEVSLNYFDKEHLKTELKAIISNPSFDANKKLFNITPLYLKNPKQALLSQVGYMQVKNLIAILYRAYLVFIKNEPNEKILKRLNRDVDIALMKLSLNGSDAGFLTILDDLFELKKLPANENGHNDAQVQISEQLKELIQRLILKS